MTKKPFSLIELIAVVAILLLIAGVATLNVDRFPSFINLKNETESLQLLLIKAARQATLQNKSINVIYIENEKLFKILTESKRNQKDLQYFIPNNIEIDIQKNEQLFQFFPDGSAYGPKITLTADEESFEISFSPLTGQSYITEVL